MDLLAIFHYVGVFPAKLVSIVSAAVYSDPAKATSGRFNGHGCL